MADVNVSIGPEMSPGILGVPVAARGIVLFAHGSGSGRLSPRNNYVASALREAGLGTLLFDLLTPAESAHRAKVFDIELLGERLQATTDWASEDMRTGGLEFGYFGASTGAAAALVAAARTRLRIGAIVSRGGRPDRAGTALENVTAPTLLIVGSLDHQVLELNADAMARLVCEKKLSIVQGATHLFEEPGTLDEVIRLARRWFLDHLGGLSDA